MESHEIIKQRSSPGILIFDLRSKLQYINEEALTIVSSTQKISKPIITSEELHIPKEIYNCCYRLKESIELDNGIPSITNDHNHINDIMRSNTGNYAIRAFLIEGKRKEYSHILVLLEKTIETHSINFSMAKTEFQLTDRELEVLVLLCEGFSNKEISKKLSITVHTVKDHMKHIMEKTHTTSRGEIVAILRQ
jgi:DNA-binding CsgD family transcriptional regulator